MEVHHYLLFQEQKKAPNLAAAAGIGGIAMGAGLVWREVASITSCGIAFPANAGRIFYLPS